MDFDLKNYKNTRKQGDVGLGIAISYFTVKGYCVSIPLTDNQDYDLVVEIENKLCKVQVKTTYHSKNNKYIVDLRTFGGNRSGQTVKSLDKDNVDFLFVLTNSFEKYLIPVKSIHSKSTLTLTPSYEKYKLEF